MFHILIFYKLNRLLFIFNHIQSKDQTRPAQSDNQTEQVPVPASPENLPIDPTSAKGIEGSKLNNCLCGDIG